MSQLIGSYTHLKNENLDTYYQALGIPFPIRKMMAFSSPKLSITSQGEEWTITTSTMLRTNTCSFKLNQEYDEDMPQGKLKSTTAAEEEKTLKTTSIGPNETKIIRTYTCTDEGCVLILTHEASGTEAKRYFKKN